jgi:hypothetical protein
VLSATVIIGSKCPYCQKWRSPRDILRHPGGVTICTSCEQRHIEALEALSTGEFHGDCAECGKNIAELPGNGQMAVHFENGRYNIMCLACDRTYTPKRAELYGETEFGRSLKLT